MLTQEGFVVADTSLPMSLPRSSWKAEAIRRGELKISGPLPITEETPLTAEEQGDFENKAGFDVSLQTQEASGEQLRQPETPLRPQPRPPSLAVQASALRSNPVEGPLPQPDNLFSPPPSKYPSTVQQEAEHVQRESIVRSVSLITPSPFEPTSDGTLMAAQKKRRRSGLRGVFRKMFGRKARDGHAVGEDDAVHRGHSYHHSDPGVLQRPPSPREQNTPSQAQIAGLPVDDLQFSQPLGQHLPFPINVNAPQPSPPHEHLIFDTQTPGFDHRRATLPTAPSISIQRHSFDEFRGRISTWEESSEEGTLLEPAIGVALSSPTQVTPPRHKRRSRSADALSDLVKDHASFDGGRSAEIKRWKESYMAENVHRPETAKSVETMRSAQVQEPRPEANNETSAILAQNYAKERLEAAEPKLDPESQVQAPASAFNFGILGTEQMREEPLSDEKAEVSNLPFANQNCAHIEDRIQHLESAYESLEGSLRRISTRNNRQTIILENVPKTQRVRDRSASNRSMSGSRSHSRSHTSIHQEPIHQASNDTLNPNKPSPVSAQSVSAVHVGDRISKDVPQAVSEALNHERTARKALEDQVLKLQHDLSDLHMLVSKLVVSTTTTSPGYPTPSPDALVKSGTEDCLLTPRAEQKFHYRDSGIRESMISKFSQSETGSESDYDEQSVQGYGGVATPDVWATPKEDVFSGSGFFTGDGRVKGCA